MEDRTPDPGAAGRPAPPDAASPAERLWWFRDAREPLPTGNSPAWQLPPWLFERLIAEMSRRRTLESIGPHCDSYELGTGVVAFEACVDETGWTTLTTFTDVGNPPPPAYLWDMLAEVAQVRLHDGGLAEGDADVEFTLEDIAIPLDHDAIVAQIVAGMDGPATRVVEPDRRAAVSRALDLAGEGDLVVLAGKGHETTQTIGDEVRPFDDVVVARELLLDRGFSMAESG